MGREQEQGGLWNPENPVASPFSYDSHWSTRGSRAEGQVSGLIYLALTSTKLKEAGGPSAVLQKYSWPCLWAQHYQRDTPNGPCGRLWLLPEGL